MKQLLSILLMLLGIEAVQAQSITAAWKKTYGTMITEYGTSIAVLPDSGFVIAGSIGTYSPSTFDIFLVRTKANGDTVWTRTVPFGKNSYASCIIVTSDGGLMIAGAMTVNGSGDVLLVKCNSFGKVLWSKTYGGTESEYAQSIRQTNDGGFIIGATASSFTNGWQDAWLLKTDSNGDTLWTRIFGGTQSDFGMSVQITSDGGFVMGGWTGSWGTMGDYYLIRTDSLGKTLWQNYYGGAGYDEGHAVIQTADGGFLISGGKEKNGGISDYTFFAVKTDEYGDTMWTGLYGKGSVNAVVQTKDKGYLLAGYFGDIFQATSIKVVKIDSSGKQIINKVFLEEGFHIAYDIQESPDGSHILTGASIYPEGSNDVFLMRIIAAPTGIIAGPSQKHPLTFSLGQNFPNPFNPATSIGFTLPAVSTIQIRVYDIMGKEAAIIADGTFSAGEHSVRFDASGLTSGIYYYRMSISENGGNTYSLSKKMVFLK